MYNKGFIKTFCNFKEFEKKINYEEKNYKFSNGICYAYNLFIGDGSFICV